MDPWRMAGGSHSVPAGNSVWSCCARVAKVLTGTPTPSPTSMVNSLYWSPITCGKSAYLRLSEVEVYPRSWTLPPTTRGCLSCCSFTAV